MNRKKLTIQSNVEAQFRILSNATFKDRLANWDENFQNADRAGAKNVYVTYQDHTVTFENDIKEDGEVLTKPDLLFTMGSSGWKKEVREAENAYGLGFFSNIQCSTYIEVYSGKYHVVFDRRDENNLELYHEETEEYVNGFRLILHNFKLEGISRADVEERIRFLAQYTHHINTYFNGELLPKKPLTIPDDSTFSMPIVKDKVFQGWLALQDALFDSKGVNVFYKGRFVECLEHFHYLRGEIHIDNHVLNLQSPDRKAIIRDNKLIELRSTIREYAKELAKQAFLNGSDRDVKEYESAIAYFVDVLDIRYDVPFSVFNGKTPKDIDYLSGIALAMQNNGSIQSIGEYEVYLRQLDAEQEAERSFFFEVEPAKVMEEENEEVDEETETYDTEEDEDSHYSSHTYSSSYDYSTSDDSTSTHSGDSDENDSDTQADEEPSFKDTRITIAEDNTDTFFWVPLKDLNKYEKRIELIQQYGIQLIVSQNKIQEQALRYFGGNVHHIKTLEEKTVITGELSNTKLSLKEKRAMMLLDMISRMYEFEENVFQIGDVMVFKRTEVPALSLSFDRIEEDINVIANTEEKRIYVDRSLIENSMLSAHTNEEIEVKDYQFLLFHLKSLIQQVSLLYKGKTEDLYEKTLAGLAIA